MRTKGAKNLEPREKAAIVLEKKISSKTSRKKSNKQIAAEYGVSENRVDSLKYEVLSPEAQLEYDKQVRRVKFKTMRIVDKGFDLIEERMDHPMSALRDIVGATKTAFDIHQLQTNHPTVITQESNESLARALFAYLLEKIPNITREKAIEAVVRKYPEIDEGKLLESGK